jgi:hypothetical protein
MTLGHWHVGFYEGNYCIEAIGFEHEEGTWDVFFDELNDHDVEKLFGSNCVIDKDYGVLIFTAEDYDDAQNKFVNWVKNVLLSFLEKK